jgi:hypothetical protein
MNKAGGLTYYYGRFDSDTAYTVSTTVSLLLGVGCVQDSGSFCAQQIYSIYTRPGDYAKVFQSGATQADAAAFCTSCKHRLLNTGILPRVGRIPVLDPPRWGLVFQSPRLDNARCLRSKAHPHGPGILLSLEFLPGPERQPQPRCGGEDDLRQHLLTPHV